MKISRPRRAAAVVLCGVVLAGCESGGSNGDLGVGSGQEPDPVAVDFPIAYTKGPLFDEDMQLQSSADARRLLRFNVGTDLYLRERASPSAPERNVTIDETMALGDVAGVQISADGTRVLFAMRGPFDPNLDDEDQPTWNIWEYDIEADALRRVIPSDINAEAGHDVSPHYLPDGRIIFASTRQRQSKAVLLDEGKPQFEALDEDRNEPAFVLHVMNDDGSDIEQVSFNQSHDLDPTVLDDGRVLFSRWDHAPGANGIRLYTMHPDGTRLELLYGARSHDTGTDGETIQFLRPRELPDGRVLAIVRPFTHPELGGDVVIIDTPTFVENEQPVALYAGMAGPAQTSATPNHVRTDLAPSPGGRFSSAFPLWDGTGRALVSWSICRLVIDEVIVACTDAALADPEAEPAPPLYGIWMYDPVDQTQLPIVMGEEGMLIGDVVAAQPRGNPQVILPLPDHPQLVEERVGILNIRSVYDVDGEALLDIEDLADPMATEADERPARFLRLVKPVSLPDDDVVDLDNTAFGVSAALGMREILGYAPIEPDGSVRVKVPADVAFAVSALDEDGRRISPRHDNWLQVRPGEELTCNGCHFPESGLSHGRSDSFDSAYAGSANPSQPFPNTDPAWFTEFGETMAETRTRLDPVALEPSVDLVFRDVWTDDSLRDPDPPLAHPYVSLLYAADGFQQTGACPDDEDVVCFPGIETARPTTQDCIGAWHAGCRIVIHYEEHIHPLWSLSRQIIDPDDGVTVLNDHTCTRCHAPVDPNDANVVAVPAADLNLTDGLSAVVAEHFHAYRQLLATRFAQEVVNGALQDILVQVGVDEDGQPILARVPLAPPMRPAGAAASDRFFSRFDPGGSHEGWLTGAELRLIAEWLDVGAQYYNDPFAVPVD